MIKRALVTLLLSLAALSGALAQTLPNLPANSVWGNLTPVTAPSRAVSLAQLQGALFSGERTIADANYIVGSTSGDVNLHVFIYTSITAARTVTLLSAASYSPGTQLYVIDRSGNSSGTLTISLAPTGADTINGANANFRAIGSAYGGILVETDGVSKWTALQTSILGNASNIWTGDQYFSGRPWCDVRAKGAKGDGLTDDTAAFTACNALGAGRINISSGTYCTFTGITLSASVDVVGAGVDATTISNCNHDVTPLTLSGTFSRVRALQVQGTNAVSTTNAAIRLTSSCISCVIEDVLAQFGRDAILNEAGDVALTRVTAQLGIRSLVNNTAGALYIKRSKLDLGVSLITGGRRTINAWAGTTSYATGTIVTSNGYYLQATVGGTSGSSSPTPTAYLSNVTDGTVTWQLACKQLCASVLASSGSSDTYIEDTDLSGIFDYGLFIANGSQSVTCRNCVFGAPFSAGVVTQANTFGVLINNSQINSCLNTGCSGVLLSGGSDAVITDSQIIGNERGVNATGSPSNFTIANNLIYNGTFGINVDPNINKFNITGNHAGLSPLLGSNTNCIKVGVGTSDNYNIIGNDCAGAISTTIVDGGSGTNKTIVNLQQVATPCTSTAGAVQYNNSGALGCVSGVTSNGSVLNYNNSTLVLLGSSSGGTTFTSDNAGVSNFTAHVPAANDTFAMIAASQVLTNKTFDTASNTWKLNGTTVATPAQLAATLSAPQVCDIISTAAATCNNGGSAANNGTYTTPANAKYLIVTMIGGGGGGGGSGTSPAAATAGGNTTFSTLTANGGALGPGTTSNSIGGAGGTVSGCDINLTGGAGGWQVGGANQPGGAGGVSFFGGAAPGTIASTVAGTAPSANSGGGGSGGGAAGTAGSGAGGGAGGYCYKLITSPNATYSYAVGASGNAGGAGTGGATGGAGAAGRITVTAYFQ